MKSDISRFGEKLVLRDAELRGAAAKEDRATEHFISASNPQIGYKLPFSIGSRPFVTKQGPGNDDILGKATHHGEGTGQLFIGEAHPNQLRTQETAPSSTFCRLCPQYGHALIFPRKCYYQAQCPLPFLFCANQHGEKAVKHSVHLGVCSGNHARNFLRRLSSTLSKKIAFNDPTKVRINGVWRKREEVPYHLRHERGSK